MHDDAHRLWPPQTKAMIFDFDGTIANTSGLWHEVDLAFLSKRDLPFDPEYPQRLSALGFVDGAHYTIERYGLNESVEDICEEWTSMARELYRTRVRLRPGVERYINAIRELDVVCALATTNEPDVLHSLRNVCVSELFQTCVYGVDVGRGKDHPDIFIEAASRVGVDPCDCMVFEDIPPAIRSAKRAGMLACGVRAHDPSQPSEIVRQEADLWLESWQNIPVSQTRKSARKKGDAHTMHRPPSRSKR